MIAAEDISVYKNEVITAIDLFASTDYEPERNEHRFRQISSSFIRKCTCPCTNLGLTVYIYKSNRLFSPYIRVNKRVYSDCTLLLVCILAGMFFKRVRRPRPFGMVFFHRFVSHYLNFFVHSYLEPYNCKYASTRMTEAALLPARLVSSPLALLSREVYVLRHVLPKMLSFSLVCLALLFSSCAILKVMRASNQASLSFDLSVFPSRFFRFLLSASSPDCFHFQRINEIYQWNRYLKLLCSLTVNNFSIRLT